MSDAPDVHRTLARNTAWNYAGFVVNLATNLVAFPYVVSRLGDSAAGVWLLLGALTGYMGLLELGMVPSLAQFIAAARGRGSEREVSRAASTALALLVALAAVPVALSFASGWLVSVLHVEQALVPEATLALRLAILAFAARMPLAALQALLLGAQRQDRCSQLWILMGWVKFACAFGVLESGGSLVHLVLAESLVHLAGGVLQWAWVRREFPGLEWSERLVSGEIGRALVSYGATLLLLNITILVIEQTDRLVIGAFLPIDQVTMYSAAWKLYMLAYAVPTTFVQALGPMIAALHGRRDEAAVRDLFFRVSKYSVALGLPLVCTLAACRELILTVWMGARFAPVGPVVLVLLVTFYVTGHNHAAHSVMAGKRRLGALLWTYNGPQAVLNLVISVALVRPMGLLGVALGTVIPALLLQPVFMRFAFAEVGVSVRQFLHEVVRPTSGLALPAFLPLLAVVAVTPAGSVVRLAVAVACSGAFAVLFWFRGMSAGERSAVGPLMPLGLGRFLVTKA